MQIACRRAKVLFVSLLFFCSFEVIASAQNTIRVPADVPSIQQAIFQANNGDVVLVAPGTYFEVLNFQGKAITVQSTDGPAVTIIDAQNSFSAVSFTTGEGPGAVLRGFTVTHGFGSQEGGGIEIVNASPTIDGNVITANQACSGSGISANGSSSVISNNTISNNSTSACTPPQGGGGVRIVGAGNVQLLNNTITGNQITNGGSGGGVVIDVLAAPLVSGNLIQNNSTSGNGGGIAVNSSALLVNNVITNNSAGTGGGIYSLLNQAQPSFLNNTVAGNSANQGTQLFIDGFDANVEISNNLLIDFSGEGAVFCGSTAGQVPAFDHNDVYSVAPTGAPAAGYTGACTDQTGFSGNINADPDFVFGPGPQPDFHLQLSSPALDAGDNSAANLPATDRDGNIRIAASNTNTCSGIVDMGAYEVVAPSTGTGVLSSSSLDFGTAFIGLPPYPTQQLTFFANGGCVQAVVSTVGDFQQTNTCGPMLGGGSCTIQLTFNPTAPGLRVGSLLINMGSGVQPVTATLTGQSQNSVFVFPASIDFGGQLVQSSSSSQSVSVSGNGNAPLQVTAISVSGDFAQLDNSCLGSSGNGCFIDLTFTPTAAGVRAGTLTIASNQGTATVLLTGTGLGPIVSVTPSSLVFASQTVGTISSSQTITLTNSGQTSLSINAVNVNPAFLVQPLTCAGTLFPGSSCTYSVAFSPQDVGSANGGDDSGTLEFDTNAGNVIVALSATVTAPLVSLSPQTLIFAPQQIGSSSAPQTVTMTNISGAPLQLSSIGASNNFLAISSCPTTLDVNASCTIDVSLAPNTAGPYNGFLSIVPNQFGGVVTAVLSTPETHQILHVPADFPSIESAISAAQNGDTVLVDPGTYFEQTNFLGKAITVASSSGPAVTILDGQNSFIPVTMGNNEPPEAVLKGFTITHGGSSGIKLSFGASPTIEDNVITGNTDCGGTGGAGILLSNSAAVIQRNTISNNDASCDSGSSGGGIEVNGSNGPAKTQIVNNVITGNLGPGNGGAGIAVVFGGTALIQNNTIQNNSTRGNGGGILVSNSSTADIIGNVITGNSAPAGAGVYERLDLFGQPLLVNNTIADNMSSSPGTALFIDGQDSNVTITNNLLIDSTGFAAVACGASNGLTPAFFNNDVQSLKGAPAYSGICQDSTGVNGNIKLDPQFVDAANNNYHLRPSSPAIDAGSVSTGTVPNRDLDGNGRPAPGNAQTCVGAIDMGAYEFELSNSGTVILPPVGSDPIQAFVGSSTTIGPSISASGCVHLSSVQTTANFTETDSCGGAVSSGSFCQIQVTFSPTDPGIRHGTLEFNFGKSSPPQTLSFNGLGLEGSNLASPTSLALGNQIVGTASPTQSVSLFPFNFGLPLEVNGIWINGDFSQTNNCNLPDPAGPGCTFSITFTPTAVGSRTGSLVVSTNQGLATVSLSGSGNSGGATLTPASLAFGNQLVNSVSATQFLTLTNTAQTTLSLGAASATGDFAASSQCGRALTPGASCAYAITFKPVAIGTRSGTFTVQTAAGTFSANLTGAGVQPAISVSPTAVNFGDQSVNSTAPSQTITVTNLGNAPLHISSTLVNGDPDLSVIVNNCTAAVPPALSCTLEVGFAPTVAGPASATLSIASDAPTSPATVALTGNGIGPIASLSPASLNFGNQLVNTSSAAQTVTLSNTGSAPLTIAGISVSGDFTQTNTCTATLAVGSSCAIQVTFTPSAAGARNGSLSISSNSAPPAPTFALTGTGVQPAISVSPASLNFGDQPINTTGPSQTITVTNSGGAPLHMTSFLVSGDPDLTLILNGCSGVLAPAASCTIQLDFTARSVGPASATLNITSDAPTSPTPVALSGNGIDPIGSLSPSGLNFGNQLVNTSSAAQTVTLSNTGTDPLSISGISVSGDFTQSNTCPASLAVGSSCTIQVTFHPTAIGTRSGTLTVSSNSSPPVVSDFVTATGVNPAISVSPASIAFGDQPVNTEAPAQTITVSNPGTTTLHVNSLSISGDPDFSTLINNCMGATGVAPGGSCSIQVEFAPKSAGSGSATLTIASDAANNPVPVSLSGTGVNPPKASISPASLSFGSLLPGTESAPQTVTVSNMGGAPLLISSQLVTGDGDFFVANSSCGGGPGVAPGSSCSIQVVFFPHSGGPGSATLTISSNDPAAPQQSVSLTGRGIDYAISAPGSLSVRSGDKVQPTITISAVGGNFSNAVSLSCSGLPTGASCSFSPSSVVPGATSATSRLTINTQQSGGIKTPPGTYSITVLGTSNGLTHSTVVTLTVTN